LTRYCGRSSGEKELEEEAKQVLLKIVKRKMKGPTVRVQEDEEAL
jgi:hypothetical protein